MCYNIIKRFVSLISFRGVMDSTMVFGTISSGSNPDGSAKKLYKKFFRIVMKQGKILVLEYLGSGKTYLADIF